jgi:hypothetical protein
VYNSIGKLMEEVKNFQPQSKIEIGQYYGPGVYYIRATGNKKSMFHKLIRL